MALLGRAGVGAGAAIVAAIVGLLGCGASPRAATSGPATTPVVPSGLTPAAGRRYLAGRAVLVREGCLACHVIGGEGQRLPGPDLSGIGRVLAPDGIRRELEHPLAPMPSARMLGLTRPALAALVFYLSELRGRQQDGIVGFNTG